MKKLCRVTLALVCVLFWLSVLPSTAKAEGKTRNYYVAVDELDWDYTPMGMDLMMDMPFDKNAKMYVESAKHQIGRVYRKAIYHEYTDGTFTTLNKRTPEWEHLGLLGPALHAEVEDTIQIFFKNNGTKSYSMHPHGVFYEKISEGFMYADNVLYDQKIGSMVSSGATFTYEWGVPERAGPGPDDLSSIV